MDSPRGGEIFSEKKSKSNIKKVFMEINLTAKLIIKSTQEGYPRDHNGEGVAWVPINLGVDIIKKWEKMTFLKKNHFFKKTQFLKKKLFLIFLLSQSQVYGYQRDPLAIVVAWVPITGVYNQFLHASGQI